MIVVLGEGTGEICKPLVVQPHKANKINIIYWVCAGSFAYSRGEEWRNGPRSTMLIRPAREATRNLNETWRERTVLTVKSWPCTGTISGLVSLVSVFHYIYFALHFFYFDVVKMQQKSCCSRFFFVFCSFFVFQHSKYIPRRRSDFTQKKKNKKRNTYFFGRVTIFSTS